MLIFEYISERKLLGKYVYELCYYEYLNRESNFTPYVDTDKLRALYEVNGILLIFF